LKIDFSPERWERIRQRWEAWLGGQLDEPMVVIDRKTADYPKNVPGFVNQLPNDMPTEDVVRLYQGTLERTQWLGDAWPRWLPNFGPGVIAGFLGSKVHPREDTVWFEPNEELDIDKMRFAFDEANFWWKRVLTITETAVKQWGNQVNVSITDIGGPMDILSAFRTPQKLLLELYDQPGQVKRLTVELTALWKDYYDRLYAVTSRSGRGSSPWASILSDGKCYMLQCDFSYMISPAMFVEFVMPELRACCGHLDRSFYHMDGVGQIGHLEHLLKLETLHGIQWVHGDGQPGHAHWIDLLGRIRRAGKLCQLYITAADAIAVVRALGGKGFAFYILDTLSESDAKHLIAELR
jgi:hypothetical protein